MSAIEKGSKADADECESWDRDTCIGCLRRGDFPLFPDEGDGDLYPVCRKCQNDTTILHPDENTIPGEIIGIRFRRGL